VAKEQWLDAEGVDSRLVRPLALDDEHKAAGVEDMRRMVLDQVQRHSPVEDMGIHMPGIAVDQELRSQACIQLGLEQLGMGMQHMAVVGILVAGELAVDALVVGETALEDTAVVLYQTLDPSWQLHLTAPFVLASSSRCLLSECESR
jgi:hypothetical protein